MFGVTSLLALLLAFHGPLALANSNDFCPSDPTVSNLEGQLQHLQQALDTYLENSDRCNCGSSCSNPTPTTPDTPTTPEPTEPECPGDSFEVESTFVELAYDEAYENQESELFLETEAELIACMESLLEDLPGEICIDVISITENDDGDGVDVIYLLTSDGQQTEDEIHDAITANSGDASYCSNYQYRAFHNFIVVVNQGSWQVVSTADPEYYRITLPMCGSFDNDLRDSESTLFQSEAARIISAVQDRFESVPGAQEIEVKRFMEADTNSQASYLALIVLKSQRFYDIRGFQDTFLDIVDSNLVATCADTEDFTITHYPLPRHRLRILDGPQPNIGRAEFVKATRLDDIWGTICTSDPQLRLSTMWPSVFCQEKGYPGAINAALVSRAGIPQGTGGPHVMNSKCNPSSTDTIYRCGRAQDYDTCDHDEDNAVHCDNLVRLVGGELRREGRLEFFAGDQETPEWGTVCVNNLLADRAQDFANVACQEMGYAGMEELSYISERSDYETATGPVTFPNPDCNPETTNTMQDCGLRPDRIACGHNFDVYLRCAEPKTPVPIPIDYPILSKVTCRENVTVYADDVLMAQRDGYFRQALSIELDSDVEVVSVVCDKTSAGGILASFSNDWRSNRDWMCTFEEQTDNAFMTSDFDDSHWETPEEISYYFGRTLPFGTVEDFDDDKASWIWPHHKKGGRLTVWCRIDFTREPKIELVGGQLPRVGAVSPIGSDAIVSDYRQFSPNWPSASCREMNYPWAEGLARADDVPEVNLAGTSGYYRFPDYCPARDDGYLSECIEFLDTDARDDAAVVSCRARLELVDGPSPNEGRLRFWYRKVEWKTVCDYDLDDATYERVCIEMGYAGLTSVQHLSNTDIDPASVPELIGLHNPVCEADDLISQCTNDPLYNDCTHAQDVYLQCHGAQPVVPEELAPIEGKAACNGAGQTTIYADGLVVASGIGEITGGVPQDVEVVGVSCVWPDDTNADEVIAEFSGLNLATGEDWLCNKQPLDLWSTIMWNPTEWNNAVVRNPDPETGYNPTTRWIQNRRNAQGEQTALYCRKQVARFYRVTTAFEDTTHDVDLEEFSAAFQQAAEFYEPLLAGVFSGLDGRHSALFQKITDGGPYVRESESVRRRRDAEDFKVVTWILRTVSDHDANAFLGLLEAAVADGNIGGFTIKAEHFTFVEVDAMYLHLRLVDGPNDHIGRAEIYKDGIWGPVCDNEFWVRDFGQLFCKTRGYRDVEGMTYARTVEYPVGDSIHTVTNPVHCEGGDNSPYTCLRDAFADITHEEDMAINCVPKIRLNLGTYMREGRLEIFDGEDWGAVCASDFTDTAWADVACHELGYGDAEIVSHTNMTTLGYEPNDNIAVFNENPYCTPLSTRSFETCGSNRHAAPCAVDQKVYLKCAGPLEETPRDLLYPITGRITCDSRIEVWTDGKKALENWSWNSPSYVEIPWYTELLAVKCIAFDYQGGILGKLDNGVKTDDTWDCIDDPNQELDGRDFSDINFDMSGYEFTKSHGMGTTNDHDKWRGHLTTFTETNPDTEWMWGRGDQGFTTVICRKILRNIPDVRLNGGRTPNEGLVEVSAGDAWGSVCETDLQTGGWPSLVCEELGFPGIKTAVYSADTYLGPGPGALHMRNPDCGPFTATSLTRCPSEGSCTHNEDVFIVCQPKIRLVEQPEGRPYEGILQWFRPDQWGYVTERDEVENVDLNDWPLRSCLDLGFPGVVSFRQVSTSETPEGHIAARTPRCAPGATSIDDCQDDTTFKPARLFRSVYLVCQSGSGGPGTVEWPVIEATGSCSGTLTVYADESLIFDSSVSGPEVDPDFTIPTDYSKLSVQCYSDNPSAGIQLLFSEELLGEWKCLHDKVPPIWHHLNFDQSSWPVAVVGAGDLAGFIKLSPSATLTAPGLPLSCSLIKPGHEEDPFDITSPAGCASFDTTLPDMWNQCAYRECVYGPNPWITSSGELSVHDVRVDCAAGEAVPRPFTSAESYPCVQSDAYCADCSQNPLYFPHPDGHCFFLECVYGGHVDDTNPQGRNRAYALPEQCPEGKGTHNTFTQGIARPCFENRRECEAPPPTTPLPTPPECEETDYDELYYPTNYLEGCFEVTNVEYVNAFERAASSAFSTINNQLTQAWDYGLCHVPAEITYNTVSIDTSPSSDGIIVHWSMVVTTTEGFNMSVVADAINFNIATGELIYYEPTMVRRFQVDSGECSITLETVNYVMSTDLDIEWDPAYGIENSPGYNTLSREYATAIEALYSSVEGEHVTRILSIEEGSIDEGGEVRSVPRITADMLTNSQETHDAMEAIFTEAVQVHNEIPPYTVARSFSVE